MGKLAHTTVLLNEAVDALNIKADGVYVDGTFGRGGHSRLILETLGENGRLIALDKDTAALKEAALITDMRFQIVHSRFADLKQVLGELGLGELTARFVQTFLKRGRIVFHRTLERLQH